MFIKIHGNKNFLQNLQKYSNKQKNTGTDVR